MVDVRTKNALYNNTTGALEVVARTLGTVIDQSAAGQPPAVKARFTINAIDYDHWLPIDDVVWATDGPLDPLTLWFNNVAVSSFAWGDPASDFDPASLDRPFRRQRKLKITFANSGTLTIISDRNGGGLTFEIVP